MEGTEIVGEGRRHINKEETTTKLNWIFFFVLFPSPFCSPLQMVGKE